MIRTEKQRIEIWKSCYKVSLANQRSYKTRLNELETWDKPFVNTPTNNEEHSIKILALKELINN